VAVAVEIGQRRLRRGGHCTEVWTIFLLQERTAALEMELAPAEIKNSDFHTKIYIFSWRIWADRYNLTKVHTQQEGERRL
jgi:hypothetical protein